MKKINHPNLIKLYEIIDDEENGKLYMSKMTTLIGKKNSCSYLICSYGSSNALGL